MLNYKSLMKTLKNYIFTFLTFFCSLTLFSQGKLGIINDPDGFTNIRIGPGKDFKVIDTLKNDFFYFQYVDDSEWAKVTVWKERQIDGYIHKSRIQEVEKLNNKDKKVLISKILVQQKILADSFYTAFKSKDTIAYRTTRRKLEDYHDTKYDPILNILPKYFCSTNDADVIQLFLATMCANQGSANEMPSFAIGDCFICNPDIVIEQLLKVKDIEQKKHLFGEIGWGLSNHFNICENGSSDNNEYNKLKSRLDNERKKVGR
jgi:hypothetical protein